MVFEGAWWRPAAHNQLQPGWQALQWRSFCMAVLECQHNRQPGTDVAVAACQISKHITMQQSCSGTAVGGKLHRHTSFAAAKLAAQDGCAASAARSKMRSVTRLQHVAPPLRSGDDAPTAVADNQRPQDPKKTCSACSIAWSRCGSCLSHYMTAACLAPAHPFITHLQTRAHDL